MRIGVLGGSFDPPHWGHIRVAELAQAQLQLDLVLFVVANDQWQKETQTPPDIRAHMVELAIAGHSSWQVSLVDVDRGGPTYSIDTYSDLCESFPNDELIFIVGEDALAGIHTWHRADEVRSTLRFGVVSRAGSEIKRTSGVNFQVIEGSAPDISSSEIRSAIRHQVDEAELQRLVPPSVATYILTVGLYRGN
jgi:nicotinate-nucleotide adenylyltransferase